MTFRAKAKSLPALFFAGALATIGFVHLAVAGDYSKVRVREKSAGCGSMSQPNGEPRRVTIEDYPCVRDVTAVRLSKDGGSFAYVVDSVVYTHPTASGGDSALVSSTDTYSRSPVWSKNGEVLFYLSDNRTSTELWKLSATGSMEKAVVTCMKAYVPELKLSPDETHLLLELKNTNPAGAPFATPSCPDPNTPVNNAAATTPEAIVVTGFEFKEDWTGETDGVDTSRVFALDIASGGLTPLTAKAGNALDPSGESADGDAAWSPDGSQIAFIREYPASLSYSTELWIAPSQGVQSGVPAKRISLPAAGRRSPSWRGDGKMIAYLLSDASKGPLALNTLAVYSTIDGTERVLTPKLDRNIVSFRFSADGSSIYFIYASDGGQYLARVRLSDGYIQTFIDGPHMVRAFDVYEDGRAAVAMNTMNEPANIYLMKPGQNPERLTDIYENYFKGLAVAPKERVMIKARDGTYLEAFVTKPLGFVPTHKYPTVLHIHGGPVSSQFSYGYSFFPQLLAANGYAVIEPNPPGSLGHGQKNLYSIYRNWGCTRYPNILLAIDYAIASGLADPKKLAVTGYSYGGYMTNCLIARVPAKFRVAASGGGHSLVAANFGFDEWLKWYVWELGPPWRNRNLYAELSPLTEAGNVTTPTLFLGGSEDWNVPILNSELFYEALRIKGVQTQLVVYPGVGHSGWGIAFDEDYYRRIVQWFDEYLKPKTIANPASN